MRLKNSNILLTGGSSGIGLAIMKGFLREGANVAFTYRKDNSLMRPDVQSILAEFPNAHPIAADFSIQTNAQALLNRVADLLNNQVDVLVNNAAAFSRAKLLDTTQESLKEILDVNIVTPFMLISAFSKVLISCKKEGSIINISSLSAFMARSQMSAYQCSKAGLEMLSTSAAYELASHRIRSNVIAPGLTETGANLQQRLNQPEIWVQRSSSIPLGRTGQPEDYVGAAIYLASSESRWVTGAKIVIDGGMSTF